MCVSFDASKSTKGASKLRRDLINTEIGHLRDLLPLPASTRQRLSQLQLMALVCVYVRKANYFQQVFKRHDLGQMPTPSIGFSKAMNGFLMMMTQNGKLLYISDNAAEYLGHSMEDLLIHGDSVYDIIDKQDHQNVQNELGRPPGSVAAPHAAVTAADDARIFLCRMNVSRNARRQMRFGDQKVILVEGHFVSYLPLCTRNEPVLIATCTPVAMPETRECVVQGATNIFTSVHNMDMKFASIDASGEFYLGYSRQELLDVSWYQLLHWDFMREAQSKHRLITQSEQDRSCILLVRLQRRNGTWLWIHCVLQVKDASEAGQQPVIICTNQVLSEREAQVMRANSWLYHFYLVQTKLQYGMNYEGQPAAQQQASTSRSSASASSPGGGYGYSHLMNNPSPVPSSCSASGDTSNTPQPVHFQQQQQQQQHLVPPPLASPLYVPPPPPPHHHHAHNHLYSSPVMDTYQHFALHPQQQQQQHHHHQHHHQQQQQQHHIHPQSGSSNTTSGSASNPHFAFAPSPNAGHHQNYSAGPAFSLGPQEASPYHSGHQQLQHNIKTEAYLSDIGDRPELGGYHIKIEAKSDEFQQASAMDSNAMASGVYGSSAVKEEPVVIESPEDAMSPASSPPRKRYRLMAATLPSSTPPSAFPPNGSGIGGEHQQLHQQTHPQQHQHQQNDWHRNHRNDHHPHSGYGQSVWPNAGWINTSYPVGLAQLEEAGYDSPDMAYDRDSSFSPLIGISIGRASSPLSASSPSSHAQQQRRLLLRRKQQQPASAMDPTDCLPHGRYHSAESVQRVSDVSMTMPPELSPLGYVLTPAPTPPDAEEAPSVSFPQSGGIVEMEQRGPASLSSEPEGANSSMSFINAAILSGQNDVVENQAILLDPANRHYVYHAASSSAASVASAASAAPPVETACDPTHPTPSADYHTPATPNSMDYPKP
ncbi:hypothetical protein GHT06_015397 [Daphnia sinensis]|uniref:Neuronal PAS domain-containing protein 4 n=1 Tax=Daphnia sinensis TaxID=1820382 RepID=A0AAD5KSD3_9CRUS|nr:hypothetical protein GHT06_015397 [Daphnia sinensis]